LRVSRKSVAAFCGPEAERLSKSFCLVDFAPGWMPGYSPADVFGVLPTVIGKRRSPDAKLTTRAAVMVAPR